MSVDAGVPATPTALKILRGNPGKKKLPQGEPQPEPVQTIEPPEYLEAGKGNDDPHSPLYWWDLLAARFEACGILTSADVPKFSAYCRLWAEWCRLEDAVQAEGETYEYSTKQGSIYRAINPKSILRDRAWDKLFKLGLCFGDTPSARVKLAIPNKPKQKNGIMKYTAG